MTALLAGLILYNPKDGALQFVMWGPKLLASALAPLVALIGSGVTVLGLKHRSPLAVGGGVFGAAVAAKHVIEVTVSREAGLVEAFGPDWQDRIPDSLRPRLRRHRWRPYYRRRSRGPLHLDVTFGQNSDTGRPLIADLMRPPPGVPNTGLAMIFVHGGGWWYGRKNISKFPYFQRMCSQGHLVMDINYTLAPRSSLLGMVKDVKQAIIWLKQQAHIYDLNPERIVLTGQSAGAQLAMLAAYTPNYPSFQPAMLEEDTSVRGVIAYQGPPDLVALHDDIQSRFVSRVPSGLVALIHRLIETLGFHGDSLASGISSVVGGTPADIPEIYHLLSPINYVSPTCPPTLLLQGTHDLLVDYEQVQRLYQKLQRVKAPVVYIPFPNCNHAFESVLPRVSPPAQTAAYYTERFLALLV